MKYDEELTIFPDYDELETPRNLSSSIFDDDDDDDWDDDDDDNEN